MFGRIREGKEDEQEVRKDYEQERKRSRLVRVSDSVRHAQAQGLARRIQQRSKAATPPPRQEDMNNATL